MSDSTLPAAIELHRINPEQNMRRFYVAQLAPTLFGEAQLVREWGRIGRAGQTLATTYPTPEAAEAALRALVRKKRGRGYVERS